MSTDPQRVAAFAAKPGQAALDGEKAKKRRYKAADNPRAALIPFVVESLGRPGELAMQLLRAMAPKDTASRSSELGRAYRELSTLIQIRRADLLLSSEYAQPGEPRQDAMDEDLDTDYLDTTRSSVRLGDGSMPEVLTADEPSPDPFAATPVD